MEKKEINLYWMYPDILNLHGDRGNIQAFMHIAKLMVLELNVQRVEKYEEKIDFEKADILIFNPGELKTIKRVIEKLRKDEENIKQYIEKDRYIIAIGTSGAIFANDIVSTENEIIEGLKLLDINCIERKTIIGDDIYFTLKDGEEIIGSQIQMVDIILNQAEPLGEVIYGYGNKKNGKEGAKKNNLIFTNALGPVFVKNPWWAEKILMDIAKRKQYQIEEFPIVEYEIEVKSFNSCKEFIEKKKNAKK